MSKILEQRSFFVLLGVVSLLFVLLLQPFWGSIFWATAVTILFAPVQRYLLPRMGGRANLSALLTLLICSVIVVMPVLALLSAFIQEGSNLYSMIQSQEIRPGQYIDRVVSAIPLLPSLMERTGIDTESIRSYLSSSVMTISELLAGQALNIGRDTLQFSVQLALMLYLTFFLLRDGERLVNLMKTAVPLSEDRKSLLFDKFVEVTRATIKGNLLVAIIQGSLGGLIFWLLGIPGAVLWAVVMILLSLIPAVGAPLVWIPVSIYLYTKGEWLNAFILVAYGAIIISLADNILRPYLVGRDTKLPDYIVLFSTLGGIALIGVNGFVVGPLIAAVFLAFWNILITDIDPELAK